MFYSRLLDVDDVGNKVLRQSIQKKEPALAFYFPFLRYQNCWIKKRSSPSVFVGAGNRGRKSRLSCKFTLAVMHMEAGNCKRPLSYNRQ